MPAVDPETSVFKHEVRIAARPQTVFAYFTDPARMVQWFGTEATLDPRPGGVCRVAFHSAAGVLDALAPVLGDVRPQLGRPSVMSGRFVEVDPYRRIAFTWGWEQEIFALPPQSTMVTVSFVSDADGTIVRLSHERLPAAAAAFHAAGWHHYMDRLAIAAAGQQLEPDPWQVVR